MSPIAEVITLLGLGGMILLLISFFEEDYDEDWEDEDED
jgi:hypothetical protein